MDKDADFKGMILTLKKRMSCTQQDDADLCHFLMFGHYDGIDIHCIDKWYHMRPGADAIKAGAINVRDHFQDKYTIKMYFPKRKIREEWEKKGFCYRFWETTDLDQMENTSLLKKCPFIAVAVLNLNGEYVRSGVDHFADIAGRLYETLSAERNQNVHCALFPSIGYSDYVCLFLSDNPGEIANLLDNLKKETVSREDGKKNQPLLSNFYVITGFSKAGLSSLKSLPGITLSIRVNLREGVSAGDFKTYFLNEAARELSVCKDKLASYHMFGSSDCLIISDMPFDKFIPLYFDSKLLNPGNRLFKDYISSIQSSLCVKIQDNTSVGGEIESNTSGIQYQIQFNEIAEKLTKVAKEYNRPVRGVYGLERVMKIFLNLLRSSHSFDVEYVIGHAFQVLIHNIDKTIRLAAMAEDEMKGELIDDLWEAIRLFREMAGDYLADMQRSDRSFIEGQSLSHPSIGSATKFLLFYNQYVNKIARFLADMEEDEANRTYTFIVTSGGNDMTEASDLFAYLDPADKEDQSLIVIKIPEMSLYDVRGTMFRLLHECMHFCGERKRKMRLEALLESYARAGADMFCKYIESSVYNTVKDVKVQNYRVNTDVFRLLCGEEKKRKDSMEERLKNKAADLLKRSLFDEIQDENFYYGRNLYKTVYQKSIENVFVPIMEKDDVDRTKENIKAEMAGYAYESLLEYQKYISSEIIEQVEGEGNFYTEADRLYATAVNKLARYQSQENEIDQEEGSIILRSIERYIGNNVPLSPVEEIDMDEAPVALEILAILFSVFKESYADCMAVKILNVPVEDFLLGFIYETWDLSTAFPDNEKQISRFGLEMKVLYGVEGTLTEEIRQAVIQKMCFWRQQGFCYGKRGEGDESGLKGYAEELCDRLDNHLIKYMGEFQKRMQPVEKYMNECISYLEQWLNIPEHGAKASEITKIRDCYLYANMDTDEEIYKVLDQIREAWKEMSFLGGQ